MKKSSMILLSIAIPALALADSDDSLNDTISLQEVFVRSNFLGADGSFTLYEDEGDDYGYENGAYSTITFTWDDAKSLLKISPRKGSFPGMIQQRKFRVRLAGSAIDHCIPVSFDADKGTSVRIN